MISGRPLPVHTGRRLRAAVLLALCLIGALITAGPARAQEPTPPPPIPTDQRFGAVETYHEPELADTLGLGWTRIIFYWSELEKDGPGTWNWFHAPLERIDREIAGGREVVGLLQHTPAFSTDGPPGAGVPRGLDLPVDDPANEWAVFVRRVMTAYQGRVTHWIIWNEPDIAPTDYGTLWAGSVEEYARLLKVAYLVAHEIDPSIRIHLGGLTYWHNPAYLNQLLDAIAEDPDAVQRGYYFDVVSLHVYFRPESTVEIVEALRASLAAHGLDKPIWLNETNAPPYDDPAQRWDSPDFRVTQEMQASFILQELAIALALDIERTAVYKWIDEPPLEPGFEPYGLLRSDRTPRPAFNAFATAVRYYNGTEQALRIERPELAQVILVRDGGQTTRVLWSRVPEGLVVEVPALAGSAQIIDRSGKMTPINAQGGRYTLPLEGVPCREARDCVIEGPPVLIVEQADADLERWVEMGATISAVVASPDALPPLKTAAVTAPEGAGWDLARTPAPWLLASLVLIAALLVMRRAMT